MLQLHSISHRLWKIVPCLSHFPKYFYKFRRCSSHTKINTKFVRKMSNYNHNQQFGGASRMITKNDTSRRMKNDEMTGWGSGTVALFFRWFAAKGCSSCNSGDRSMPFSKKIRNALIIFLETSMFFSLLFAAGRILGCRSSKKGELRCTSSNNPPISTKEVAPFAMSTACWCATPLVNISEMVDMKYTTSCLSNNFCTATPDVCTAQVRERTAAKSTQLPIVRWRANDTFTLVDPPATCFAAASTDRSSHTFFSAALFRAFRRAARFFPQKATVIEEYSSGSVENRSSDWVAGATLRHVMCRSRATEKVFLKLKNPLRAVDILRNVLYLSILYGRGLVCVNALFRNVSLY